VLSSAFSKELVKAYGWKGGCGNIPSAYLTGLLAGYRSIKKGVDKAILDIGLRPAKKGSRIFAALKGGLDAGLDVPHSEEMLPKENRIKGEHIANYAKMILSNPEISEHSFGKYKDRGFNHEEMLGHFEQVKDKIKKEFSK
jgi:large subunit ribosomal protein L18